MTSGGFELRTDAATGWTLGRFAALQAAGIVSAVTTRRGLDAMRVRTQPGWGAQELAEALGVAQAAWLEQIHSDVVFAVDAGGLAGHGDGLVTASKSVGLVGRSADCPLILLADAQAGVVGMAHASWRGTVRQIARRLVESAARLGARPERAIACVCPSAGACCYEVGPDVLQVATAGIGPEAEKFFSRHGQAKWKLDLWSANREQLQQAGLAGANIHIAGVCTLCNNDVFPSHRKEGDSAGRFMAMIALRQAAL